MRPARVSMNATGYSQWIPIDYLQSWFGTTVAVILSEDGNLTYTVQFTCDSWAVVPPQPTDAITISRAGTTATVTDKGPFGLGHGLSANDSVIIKSSGSSNLDSPVASTSASPYGTGDIGVTVLAGGLTSTAFTYTVANSGATTDNGNAWISRLRVFNHATLATQTTRQNGTLNYPVRAVRLNVSIYAAGYVDMLVLQGPSA